jgi:hypothetical protein
MSNRWDKNNINITCDDTALDTLKSLLVKLRRMGIEGSSREIKIEDEPETYDWDGDGPNQIGTISINGEEIQENMLTTNKNLQKIQEIMFLSKTKASTLVNMDSFSKIIFLVSIFFAGISSSVLTFRSPSRASKKQEGYLVTMLVISFLSSATMSLINYLVKKQMIVNFLSSREGQDFLLKKQLNIDNLLSLVNKMRQDFINVKENILKMSPNNSVKIINKVNNGGRIFKTREEELQDMVLNSIENNKKEVTFNEITFAKYFSYKFDLSNLKIKGLPSSYIGYEYSDVLEQFDDFFVSDDKRRKTISEIRESASQISKYTDRAIVELYKLQSEN